VPTVTFILGLCGSGKTHLSEELALQSGADIFESLVGNNAFAELSQRLASGMDCIVEEICFCIPSWRDEILQILSQIEGLEVRWICFENDLDSANWNVDRRTNKADAETHNRINQQLHPHYVYPNGADIRPIHRIP